VPERCEVCHDAALEIEDILWMLLALAAVVVLLTRLRLHANTQQAGHARVCDGLVDAHTVVGLLMLVAGVLYLASPSEAKGCLAAVVWWAEAIIGLLVPARWLPGGGRHTAPATDDIWA
jgi:cytochrome bd-type quinol oxidase subunit 2